MKYNLEIYKNLNLLFVEDEKATREMYASLFSNLFKNVYTAKDGLEGLEIFKKEKIDIIMSDYLMPKMNGLEMAKHIREIDLSVPIILVTAFEDIEILRKAIDLGISGFVKKPITSKSIFSTLEFVAKSVLAERLLIEKQKNEILYSNYQQNLTYKKEMKIIKNEINDKFLNFSCEIFYKPKDILSGDSYIIKKINEEEYLFFVVDAMGKGIAASATAMLCSAFVNFEVDEIKNNFSLKDLIEKFINFIKPNLLDEEIVCASFVYFNKDFIKYCMFSMPPILYQKDKVEKIKSNNPPISPYTEEFDINTLDINLKKMLIYTDGVNEHTTKDNNLYGKDLIKDFENSNNLNDLLSKMNSKIISQEDDITMIFIKNL